MGNSNFTKKAFTNDILVKVVKVHKDAKLPKKALPNDVGYDIFSDEELVIKAGERKIVGTGIKLALPQGVEGQIRPKSGLAISKGITVLNSPGTIDPNYRGEVKVILINLSNADVKIEKGQKIAQIVFSRFESPKIVEAKRLGKTERNEKGFGSTGLK